MSIVWLTNDVLIIGEFDFRYIQSFATIQFLFVLQNIVVEELLQLLVTIIDAKLFEWINGKVFCRVENNNQLNSTTISQIDSHTESSNI